MTQMFFILIVLSGYWLYDLITDISIVIDLIDKESKNGRYL
jgi:hypothetical protein